MLTPNVTDTELPCVAWSSKGTLQLAHNKLLAWLASQAKLGVGDRLPSSPNHRERRAARIHVLASASRPALRLGGSIHGHRWSAEHLITARPAGLGRGGASASTIFRQVGARLIGGLLSVRLALRSCNGVSLCKGPRSPPPRLPGNHRGILIGNEYQVM